MTQKVLILDPGGSTGWTLFHDTVMVGHGQLPGPGPEPGPHHKALWDLLHRAWRAEPEQGQLRIICERFDHRNREAASLISKEYIGIVNLFLQKVSAYTSVAWQGADQAKLFATNDKLQKMGLLIRPITANKHANDTVRHFVYYTCNNKEADPELRLDLLKRLK
jgi:hypothetical protein